MESADDRTGRTPTRVPITVNSHEDFVRLRKIWNGMPQIPKIIHRDDAPEIVFPGQVAKVLLNGEETGGQIAVFELTLDPSFAAGRHYQPNEDETWYVLEGQLEITIGTQTAIVGPGALAYAPRTATHAFKPVGDARCRMLTMNAPAGHERSFEKGQEMARNGLRGDRQLRLKALADHETIFPDGPAWGMGLADGKSPTADARTGQKVEKVPITVNSHEDFVRLREIWSTMPRIPKIIRREEAPDASFPGQDTKVLLSGEETGGSVTFFDLILHPSYGASEHHQPNEDEIFFILDGQLDVTVGKQHATVGPGSLLYAPRMSTHAFKNNGTTPCHVLTWNSPAGHERAFEGGRRLAEEGRNDEPSMIKMLADHETIFHDR